MIGCRLRALDRSDVIFFSVHRIRKTLGMICPITSDTNFDRLVTVVSARFPYHKVMLVYAL